MKYIIRLIALPFWTSVYLVFSIYRMINGLIRLCYGFLVHGGEQITCDDSLNKHSILKTYLKLEEIEASLKIDPRSHCNHVWEQEVGYSSTSSAPRQKCVICGVQVTNHFTQQ